MTTQRAFFLIICLAAVNTAQATSFLERVTGNFHLRKSISSPNFAFKKSSVRHCPKDIKIQFDELQTSLELRHRITNQVIEVFSDINLERGLEKIDTMIWQETKTTLKRSVLTKRSRLCKGVVSRSCEGNFRPRTSLLSSKEDLVLNIYGQNHSLKEKCYYQRPNEIGL